MPAVGLRLLRPGDDAALIALFADPITALWNPGPAAADVPRWRADNTEPAADFRTWAITDPAITDPVTNDPAITDPVTTNPDVLLGVVSVFSIDPVTGSAEVGFRLSPEARGRGLARGAVAAALDRVAAEAGVTRVEAWHAVENETSCRVLSACGFLLDAVLPANHVYGDDRRYDEHRHVRAVDAGPAPAGSSRSTM